MMEGIGLDKDEIDSIHKRFSLHNHHIMNIDTLTSALESY
jgi:hypothetical protein